MVAATPSTQRVIPRPSERRGARTNDAEHIVTNDGLIIEAGGRSTPFGRDASRGAPTWPAASLRAIGAVSGLGAGLAFGLLGFFGREDTLLGIVVAPVLTLVVAIVAKRFVRPRLGEFVAAGVLAGFGARMAGAVPRLIGGADSPVYQLEGLRIAESLRAFDFGVDTGRSIPGTGAVRYFSGIVNVVTNGNYITTFLLFAAFALVGQVFFLFAVRPVLDDRQMSIATLLVMFSPTMVYWPSSIGKESMALFGIGVALYGASLVYARHWRGLLPLIGGVLVVGLVRPHVAILVLVALGVGLLARPVDTRRRFAIRVVVLGLVMVGAMLAASASAELFDLETFDGVSDLSAALDFAENRTTQDTSEFEAARVESVTDYPAAVVTVLFRPFVWEASGLPAMVSALEASLLALLLAVSLPSIVGQIRTIMSSGQLLFALGYISVFIFLFSAIGNFGILSRQRAQVIPFVLLLIALGLGADKVRDRRVVR